MILGVDPGDSGIPCFHLNPRVLTFLLKFIILCKITSRFMFLGAHRVTYAAIPASA